MSHSWFYENRQNGSEDKSNNETVDFACNPICLILINGISLLCVYVTHLYFKRMKNIDIRQDYLAPL